jgi:hypothetical protein
VSGTGIKKKHLGEKAWRDVVTRFEASGMGVTAFCRREGVGIGSLRLWQERLSKMAVPLSTSSPSAPLFVPPAPKSKPPTLTVPNFIEVGTLGQASVGSGRLEIKLDLGGGLSLHLVRG